MMMSMMAAPARSDSFQEIFATLSQLPRMQPSPLALCSSAGEGRAMCSQKMMFGGVDGIAFDPLNTTTPTTLNTLSPADLDQLLSESEFALTGFVAPSATAAAAAAAVADQMLPLGSFLDAGLVVSMPAPSVAHQEMPVAAAAPLAPLRSLSSFLTGTTTAVGDMEFFDVADSLSFDSLLPDPKQQQQQQLEQASAALFYVGLTTTTTTTVATAANTTATELTLASPCYAEHAMEEDDDDEEDEEDEEDDDADYSGTPNTTTTTTTGKSSGGARKRKPKQRVSEEERNTEKYRIRRAKNTAAAARNRAMKREQARMAMLQLPILDRRNADLRSEAAALRAELAQLVTLVHARVASL